MVEEFGIWPVDGGLYVQDPDFIDELRLERTARHDHELFSIDAKDNPKVRQRQDKRRVQLARWRRGE